MESKNINSLLKLSREQHVLFSSLDATNKRLVYRQEHPTEIAFLGCMDGRINQTVMTKTLPGIIYPFRDLGGKFDLGNNHLSTILQNIVDNAINSKNSVLFLVTYHFSRSNPHLGCAGFDYNKEIAIKEIKRVCMTIDKIFEEKHQVVLPILVGIETDTDSMIFHNHKDNAVFDVAEHLDFSSSEILVAIKNLYPDTTEQVTLDLLPLVLGNQEHVKDVLASGRLTKENNHKEFILGVGRGFEWMNELNTALIVGPYHDDLREAIKKEATILLSNITANRIKKEDGVIVITSSTFGYRRNTNTDQLFAKEKARSLAATTQSVIQKEVPELWPFVSQITGIFNKKTFEFTPVEI